MKNVKNYWFVTYILVLITILVLYAALYMNPTLSKIAAADQKHATYSQQIMKYNNDIKNKQTFLDNIQKLQDQIQQAKTNMPGIPMAQLGDEISKGIAAAGIQANSVMVGTPATVQNAPKSSEGYQLKAIPISIVIGGGESNLEALLKYFEKSSNGVFYVTTVNYTFTDKFSATVAINMYFYGSGSSGNTIFYYYPSGSAAAQDGLTGA